MRISGYSFICNLAMCLDLILFEVFSHFMFLFSGILGSALTVQRKKGGTSRVHCSAETPPPAWPGRAVPDKNIKTWDGPKPISIVGSTGSIGTQVRS